MTSFEKIRLLSKLFYIITLSLLFLSFFDGTRYDQSQNVPSGDIWENFPNDDPPLKSADWILTSIEIDDSATGTGAHNWTWAASQPWCSGAGTIGDPYIIENVSIDALNKGFGISISHSVKYAIIQNCFIENGGYYDEGILFYNVSNARIEQNKFVDNTKAIVISHYSDNNTISYNNITGKTLSSGEWGISVSSYCDNTTIIHNHLDYVGLAIKVESTSHYANISLNIIESISDVGITISSACVNFSITENTLNVGETNGIYIYNSQYGQVSANSISYMNQNGIFLNYYANHNNITQNTLILNDVSGIRIEESNNNSLNNNIMTGSGLTLYAGNPDLNDYLHYIDPSNTIDGDPIYYYSHKTNLSALNFTNAGQIYLVNCSDSQIRNFNLTNNDYGVLLADCENITVTECTFLANLYDGIYAFSTSNSIFTQNNCSQNKRHGINLDRYCNANKISFNNFSSNGDASGSDHGIYIYSYSEHNQIDHNWVWDNDDYGIYAVDHCFNISIFMNEVHYNTNYGIIVGSTSEYAKIYGNNVSHSYTGIYLDHYCDFGAIYGNNISLNQDYGLHVNYDCDDVNITNNNITHNGITDGDFGIRVNYNCDRIRIQYNFISQNFRYGLQLSSVTGVNVSDNQFENSGINMYGSSPSHYLQNFNLNNSYDGGWIYYYVYRYNLLASDFTEARQIYLVNCIGAEMNDVTIDDEQYGLFLYNSSYIHVYNGNFTYNNDYGLHLTTSSYNEFTNCSISYTEDYDLIYLQSQSHNNTFISNDLYHTQSLYQEGISLYNYCLNNTFFNNSVIEAGNYGIDVGTDCAFNNFTQNIVNSTRRYEGIRVYSNSDNNIFSGNMIGDSNRYGIYCGANSDGNLFEKNIITESGGIYAIYIATNCHNNTFSYNNITYNYGQGFYIYNNCDNITIDGNIISHNGGTSSLGYGIYIHSFCDYATITNNIITENRKTGIFFQDECKDAFIISNRIEMNQEYGFYSEDQCRSLTLISNNISYNGLHGMYIFNDCDDYLIEKNRIVNNTDHGIYIDDYCNANVLFNNTIANNTVMGIGFYDFTNNNHIYLNYFLNNTQHAIDNSVGFINHWDNGSIGNYWDNYTDFDKDDNGIGDAAWLILGSAGQYDAYPIWLDGKDLDPFPDISSPADIHYYFRAVGNNITWVANATSPDYYIITRNGTIITEGVWFNFIPISINVDSLDIGHYLYSCIVNSTYAATEVSDEVLVIVERTAPLITHPLDLVYQVGTPNVNITWIGDSPFPDIFVIFQDGEEVFSADWFHLTPVVYVLPNLLPGIYVFECFLNASSGESITDTVTIEIWEPAILISHPANVNYTVTSTANFISWTGQSPIPDSVLIYRDDVLVYADSWNSSVPINHTIDGLMPGSYVYLCILNSTSGFTTSDSVYLTVNEPMITITHPSDISYEYGAAGAEITWISSSLIPDSYLILMNGNPLFTGDLNSDAPIVYPVSGLSLGTYSFECIVNSTSNLQTSDSVLVHVLEPLPRISTLDDRIINGTNSNETIVWIGTSPFAENLTILQDGEPIFEGPWVSGVPVALPLANLTAGRYVFECIMTTSTGLSVSDTVVIVIDDPNAVDPFFQYQADKEKAEKRSKILWIVVIILAIVLSASIGANTYYIRKQKDYRAYSDILHETDRKKYEQARDDAYLTDADQMGGVKAKNHGVASRIKSLEIGSKIKGVSQGFSARIGTIWSKITNRSPPTHATKADLTSTEYQAEDTHSGPKSQKLRFSPRRSQADPGTIGKSDVSDTDKSFEPRTLPGVNDKTVIISHKDFNTKKIETAQDGTKTKAAAKSKSEKSSLETKTSKGETDGKPKKD